MPDNATFGAMLDSRQRWRDLAGLLADIAFETDAQGRLVFLFPDLVAGWPADRLIGQPATMLLASPEGPDNPFCATADIPRHRVWLRRPNGLPVCFAIGAAVLRDNQGQPVGMRGAGLDLTVEDRQREATSAMLRRADVVDDILHQIRQQVAAPRMLETALLALQQALGAEGAALFDALPALVSPAMSQDFWAQDGAPNDAWHPAVMHQVGAGLADIMAPGLRLLRAALHEVSGAQDVSGARATLAAGRHLLFCPTQTRFGECGGLLLWRAPGGRAFDAEDHRLATATAGILRVILEHGSVQRELALQARTDPLTGLLNRRAFLDEFPRRLDRLDRDQLPGTLLFVDLDHFKLLNDTCGHGVGDDALCLVARMLRATTRPADLVARLGGDEFAIWMDGADQFTAAERAEALRWSAPAALAALAPGHDLGLAMSIGIACRPSFGTEDVDSLLRRADLAMYEVKRQGRGHWRVSPPPADGGGIA